MCVVTTASFGFLPIIRSIFHLGLRSHGLNPPPSATAQLPAHNEQIFDKEELEEQLDNLSLPSHSSSDSIMDLCTSGLVLHNKNSTVCIIVFMHTLTQEN